MALRARPATESDLAELVALQEREDKYWFGASEHDEAEVRESIGRANPLAQRSRLVHDDGQLVAAAWWWGPHDAWLMVDEITDAAAVYDDLLPWFAGSGVTRLEALDRDNQRRGALAQHGWEHFLSQFELIRDASPLPAARWPTGVTTTALGEDSETVYRVIYDEAGWAEIPGHGRRDLDEWRSLFVSSVDPQQQVLAWQAGRLVGAALGKTFSDGVGWVSQLAVSRDQQGRGLGTALLMEAFNRRLSAGAARLGLGVSAANKDALRLYLSIGLEIDREWMLHRPTS